jgi:hypothetical protein
MQNRSLSNRLNNLEQHQQPLVSNKKAPKSHKHLNINAIMALSHEGAYFEAG